MNHQPSRSIHQPSTLLTGRDTLLCDFDGTVTQHDIGLTTMQTFARPGWWEIEHAWRRGDISSMECMTRQFALVNVSQQQFRRFVERQALDPAFGDLVQLCRNVGAGLIILSDGLELYIRWLLQKHGLTDLHVIASHGRFDHDDRIVCSFPHQHPICKRHGNCKLAHLLRARRHSARIIYVGDGYTDFCPAAHADIVFAKDVLARYCQRAGIPALPFDRLADVVAALG